MPTLPSIAELMALTPKALAEAVPSEAELNSVIYNLATTGEESPELAKLIEAVRSAWREHI